MSTYTYSQLQQFMQCPRKYKYDYEDLVRPVYDGVPRPVGGALHAGIAELYLGQSKEVARDVAHGVYWAELGAVAQGVDEKEAQKIENGWVQVAEMLMGYPDYGDVGNTVAVEKELEVPLRDGRVYRGKLDRILEINGDGWVHDTKTTGFALDKVLKSHRLRMQYVGYFLLAQEWARGQGRVAPIGVMLDLIGKPRVYNRKDGTTSSSGLVFHREPIHVSPRMAQEFIEWFHYNVDLVQCNQVNGVWPKNTDNCLSFNRVCAYFEACRSPQRAEQLFADTKGFEKRDRQHVELRGDDGEDSGSAG